MSEWSHLPNAVHIDRVLASVKANPKIWSDAWHAPRAAIDGGRLAAHDAASDAASDAAYFAARLAAKDAAWVADQVAAYYAARDAILALVAYDDTAKYLDLPLDQLKMLYVLSEDPAALLLQPAVLAFAMEKALA